MTNDFDSPGCMKTKARKIRVAIPTDDGVSIKSGFSGSRGFAVAVVENETIIRQEIRWNLLSEILTSAYGMYYNLEDCDVVIVNEICDGHRDMLHGYRKEVVETGHTEIMSAIRYYLVENGAGNNGNNSKANNNK
jgi:hypothetical protein